MLNMADKKLTKTKGLIKWLNENGHTVEEAQQEIDISLLIGKKV
jgi:hypothetical protein